MANIDAESKEQNVSQNILKSDTAKDAIIKTTVLAVVPLVFAVVSSIACFVAATAVSKDACHSKALISLLRKTDKVQLS